MITTEPFGDRISNLTVNLEVTGTDPNDTSGGTGSVTLGTSDVDNFHLWVGAPLEVRDANNTLAASISGATVSNEATASVSAELPLYLANVHRSIPPLPGPLNAVLLYLGATVGMI